VKEKGGSRHPRRLGHNCKYSHQSNWHGQFKFWCIYKPCRPRAQVKIDGKFKKHYSPVLAFLMVASYICLNGTFARAASFLHDSNSGVA
jgi:hypothetical protein